MRKKIVYYTDELNDDFSGTNIKQKPLKENFKYINRNPFWNTIAWFLYNCIAAPFGWLFCKIKLRIRYKNRKVLKKHRKKGYFIYANHTQGTADAFIPALATSPKKNYVLVNKDAVAIPGIKQFVLMLGGVPVAETINNMKGMTNCIKYRIKKKKAVTIYPEAHIWPYCTKIRNFSSASFRYPVEFNAPTFSSTTVYRKRRGLSKLWSKKPRATTYIDGPFYPDRTLSKKDAIQKLRNDVYSAMRKRAHTTTNYEYIRYIKKEKIERTEK